MKKVLGSVFTVSMTNIGRLRTFLEKVKQKTAPTSKLAKPILWNEKGKGSTVLLWYASSFFCTGNQEKNMMWQLSFPVTTVVHFHIHDYVEKHIKVHFTWNAIRIFFHWTNKVNIFVFYVLSFVNSCTTVSYPI